MQWASIFGTSVFGTSMRNIGTGVLPDVLTSEFTPPIETESPDFRTHFGLPSPDLFGESRGFPMTALCHHRKSIGNPLEQLNAERAGQRRGRLRCVRRQAFCSEVASAPRTPSAPRSRGFTVGKPAAAGQPPEFESGPPMSPTMKWKIMTMCCASLRGCLFRWLMIVVIVTCLL